MFRSKNEKPVKKKVFVIECDPFKKDYKRKKVDKPACERIQKQREYRRGINKSLKEYKKQYDRDHIERYRELNKKYTEILTDSVVLAKFKKELRDAMPDELVETIRYLRLLNREIRRRNEAA